MDEIKVINMGKYKIKVVPPVKRTTDISSNDNEMDVRAIAAVRAAIDKAKVCKKPVAGYDVVTKRAYIQYADGVKKYAK